MGFEWVRGGAPNPLSWQESQCRLLSPSCNLCWRVTGSTQGCEDASYQKTPHVSEMAEIVHPVQTQPFFKTLVTPVLLKMQAVVLHPAATAFWMPKMRARGCLSLKKRMREDVKWQRALQVQRTNTNLFVLNSVWYILCIDHQCSPVRKGPGRLFGYGQQILCKHLA